MKRDTSRLVLGGLTVAVLCIGALTGCDDRRPMTPGVPDDPAPTSTAAAALTSVETEVTRVIDGDTVAVTPVQGVLEPTGEDADEHVVRILGIDAPEMNDSDAALPECGAQEATGHLEQTLPSACP